MKTPQSPHICVSPAGDVLIRKPGNAPAFLFVSRLCLHSFISAPHTVRKHWITGLAAECLNSWIAAELPFTWECISATPITLAFRLKTGLAVALTVEAPSTPFPSYLAGVDLVITTNEAVRRPTTTLESPQPALEFSDARHPKADDIEAAVMTIALFHLKEGNL